MVEFGLVFVPLLAIVFLIMDVAWLCFAQSSLQHAVQVAVRAAVVNPAPPKDVGQDDYLKNIVQQNAMGFLAGTSGLNSITIEYYTPGGVKIPNGGNAPGNIIVITVKDVAVSALGPILRENLATLYLHANSSDVMEALAPGASTPPR
jgi:hypothetical protein